MSLSLAEAIAYIDKGIEKASQMNISVTLAVVDEYGNLVQLDRMDGASAMSVDIAEAKALSALNFKRPTSKLGQDFLSSTQGMDNLRRIEQIVRFNVNAAPGGVPLYGDGRLVGAIGVSGATAQQDEEVAMYAAASS